MKIRLSSVIIVLFVLFPSGALISQVPRRLPPNLRDFLKANIHFSKKEFKALDKGKVVTKLLDTPLRQEVGVFGIIRLHIPMETYLEHLLKDRLLLEVTDALELGIFNNPPSLEDVGSLTLDSKDIKALRKSKIGKSKIKLSAKSIKRFQNEIDWAEPDAKAKALLLSKNIMINYIGDYLTYGDSAMVVYQDKKRPVSSAVEFQNLVQQSLYLTRYQPQFQKYLENYPQQSLPGMQELICWVKKDMGTGRQVLSIDQITIYQPDSTRLARTLIAAKQLYASHYFEASLGLTLLVPDPESESGGFYLIYLNYSSIDALRRRFFLGIVRRKIRKGVLKVVKKKLTEIEKKAEILQAQHIQMQGLTR